MRHLLSWVASSLLATTAFADEDLSEDATRYCAREQVWDLLARGYSSHGLRTLEEGEDGELKMRVEARPDVSYMIHACADHDLGYPSIQVTGSDPSNPPDIGPQARNALSRGGKEATMEVRVATQQELVIVLRFPERAGDGSASLGLAMK